VTKPLVFQHGAAATLFRVVIGVWAVLELIGAVRQRWLVGHWRHSGRDPSGIVLAICMPGAVFAAVRLGRDGALTWPGSRVGPVVVGLGLVAIGIGLRAWSIASLGRSIRAGRLVGGQSLAPIVLCSGSVRDDRGTGRAQLAAVAGDREVL
jgi:protein-S-isoprenylcysteine O-methyltransferase Ste14